MKHVLLDTHSLIFLALFPERLSPKAKEFIASGVELFCSDISLWEIAMLLSKGRIIIDVPTETFIEDIITAHNIEVLPITASIAASSQKWAHTHKDPNLLITAATAYSYDIPLITKNEALQKISEIKTVW